MKGDKNNIIINNLLCAYGTKCDKNSITTKDLFMASLCGIKGDKNGLTTKDLFMASLFGIKGGDDSITTKDLFMTCLYWTKGVYKSITTKVYKEDQLSICKKKKFLSYFLTNFWVINHKSDTNAISKAQALLLLQPLNKSYKLQHISSHRHKLRPHHFQRGNTSSYCYSIINFLLVFLSLSKDKK